jgi:hypothetical protein
MRPASTLRSRKTTVDGSGASIASTESNAALRCETMPPGARRIRSKLALTSADVSAEPSWNRMSGRSLKV